MIHNFISLSLVLVETAKNAVKKQELRSEVRVFDLAYAFLFYILVYVVLSRN